MRGNVLNVYGIRGTVSAGMFPNERAIVLTDHNGETYTLIVSADIVSRDGVIHVRVIDEQGGIALVRLPGELLGAGSVISVQRSELEPV